MHGNRLFTIPIYIRDPKSHYKREEEKKEKYLTDIIKPLNPEERREWGYRYDKTMSSPWRYTQIIGAVEITVDHFGDLKAYYWYVDAKRVSDRMNQKRYRYAGKLFDVSKLGRPNERIREEIQYFISVLPRLRNRFKNRYFDFTEIKTLLPAIDFGVINAPD